jgi:hypothetical protein
VLAARPHAEEGGVASSTESAMSGGDPGWRPALAGLAWVLLPPLALYRRQRRVEAGQADGLIALRSLVLSFGFPLVLINVVVYLLDVNGDTGGWPDIAGVGLVVGNGVLDLIVVRFWRGPLDCGSDASLAASYRTRLFLRLAFANSAALVGFVGFFLTGIGLLYPLGMVFSIAGYASFLPTAAHLERDQEDLLDNGCGRSLVTALRTGGWPPR